MGRGERVREAAYERARTKREKPRGDQEGNEKGKAKTTGKKHGRRIEPCFSARASPAPGVRGCASAGFMVSKARQGSSSSNADKLSAPYRLETRRHLRAGLVRVAEEGEGGQTR